jgi:hypothetical protein
MCAAVWESGQPGGGGGRFSTLFWRSAGVRRSQSLQYLPTQNLHRLDYLCREMEERNPAQRRRRWYIQGANRDSSYDPSSEIPCHIFTALALIALLCFSYYFFFHMIYQCPHYRMYRYGEAVTRVWTAMDQYKSCMYFDLQVFPHLRLCWLTAG